MSLKNLFLAAILGVILLTFSLFTGVQGNKINKIASDRADFTLNSKPRISFNFPEGKPPDTFIEPITPKIVQEGNLAAKPPSGKPKINPTDLGPGMALDLKDVQVFAPSSFKEAPKFVEDPLEKSVKLLLPTSLEDVDELLELLKGFGELINVPKDQLTAEFAKRDALIIEKTKQVYRNPTNFVLGQQCGGEGPAFTYPPGSTTFTACGGEREYSVSGSGGLCGTDQRCLGTGFCRVHRYTYRVGSWTYCWVPSCFGVCRGSAYLWDSVTKTCGCGT